MSMDLTFLGTGSAFPSPHRGASALVLRTEGECWLFDCGEGTQTQLMKSRVKARVKPGPLYGRLKSGQSITLDSGRMLHPAEVLEPAQRGRKVCVFGDCSALVGTGGRTACQGADVLVHEATLDDGQQEKAVEHGHSTPSMAAAVALTCGVRTLVLHHFSQRYRPTGERREGRGAGEQQEGRERSEGGGDDVGQLKVQAELALQGSSTRVILAEDFLTVPVLLREPH